MFARVAEDAVAVAGQYCQPGDRGRSLEAEGGGVPNSSGVLVYQRRQPRQSGRGGEADSAQLVMQPAEPAPCREMREDIGHIRGRGALPAKA